MTESGRAEAQKVAYSFIDAQFPWLPKPKITEWDNLTVGTNRYYATATTISVPKYSDVWNDGRFDLVIHEVGHVVVFFCSQFGEVLTPFLIAMGGDPAIRQHPLINEIIAEHFARAYVVGYAGANYPQLVGLVPFDIDKTRAFFQSLSEMPKRATVATTVVTTVSAPAHISQPDPVPTALLRFCYDSTNARDIPAGVQIVAGYIDGLYKWSDADWALFPNSVRVRIACFSDTNDGDVGDVEIGDMTPAAGVAWVLKRRAAGVDPTIYTGLGQWAAVRAAFDNAGVKQPHYWIAHYDNDPTPIPGAFAKQYANPTWTGKHYDVSVVTGRWPGVEEDDVAFKDDPDAQAFAKDVKDSLDAIKAVLATQAHHKHLAAVTTTEPQ